MINAAHMTGANLALLYWTGSCSRCGLSRLLFPSTKSEQVFWHVPPMTPTTYEMFVIFCVYSHLHPIFHYPQTHSLYFQWMHKTHLTSSEFVGPCVALKSSTMQRLSCETNLQRYSRPRWRELLRYNMESSNTARSSKKEKRLHSLF
jgi:hypothetical protein